MRRQVHVVPHARARVDLFERNKTNTGWGDLSAARLITVMNNAAKGEVADWADLCEYMIDSDDLFSSLYETYVTRIVQADWIVAPNPYGDRELAKKAAHLCDNLFARISNTNQLMRDLLHAVSPGYSVNEIHWARDHANSLNYVDRVEHVHGHRIRFDLRWQPRLYDRGLRMGADGYGEVAAPNLWVVHKHQIQSGYPGIAGVMRSCAIKWLFRRWVAKWEINNLEVHGRPIVYAEVGPNTPETVRSQILTDLENLSADHYGVMEAGTKLIVDATAAASKNYEAFRQFANGTKGDIVTAWIGHSDAVDPGAHGSQSAIETRAGETADPRMVSRGVSLGNTIASQLFRPMIELNSHKLGVDADKWQMVPVPEFRLKTAADEAEVDQSDLADERADEGGKTSVQVPGEVRREPSGDAPAPVVTRNEPVDGTQFKSVTELVEKVATGAVPIESAKGILTVLLHVAEDDADRILAGIVVKRAPEPTPDDAPPPSPKSKSPLARALRGEIN